MPSDGNSDRSNTAPGSLLPPPSMPPPSSAPPTDGLAPDASGGNACPPPPNGDVDAVDDAPSGGE
eukprot:ctg_7027.g495